MKELYKTKSKENGQSLVELALSITILMILLAGTIDLGRAFFTWIALRDSAQEGASYGSINPPGSDVSCTPLNAPYPEICQRVYDNLNQVISNSSTQTIVMVFPHGGCMGDTVEVNVFYPKFPITMPFLSTIIGNDYFPIQASVTDTILTPGCH